MRQWDELRLEHAFAGPIGSEWKTLRLSENLVKNRRRLARSAHWLLQPPGRDEAGQSMFVNVALDCCLTYLAPLGNVYTIYIFLEEFISTFFLFLWNEPRSKTNQHIYLIRRAPFSL
jgi:hypothetical protein